MSSKGIRPIPLKLPPDYFARTLSRLLPAAAQIATFNREQLIALDLKKRTLEKLIKSEPCRFFIPNRGGQREFLEHSDPVKRLRLFFSGNKGGKTTGGAIRMGERLIGRPLWDIERRKHISYRTPAVGICFAEDFESHRDTILPTIASWWPKAEIHRVTYGTQNCPSEIELKNGSLCKFKTYAQGADTAEGKDYDIVWHDEPPPYNIYTATFRGLVATGGEMMITATLLKEVWLYDEKDKDFAIGFSGEIHDNDWLDEQAKADFLEALTDEEREVREFGKPMSLVGLIYKSFKDSPPYVIPSFELPSNWPYFIGVDPHERKPVHILFFTLSPQNRKIAFGHCFLKGSTEEIFEQLAAKIKEFQIPGPIRLAIMDPNRGAARQINQTSWESEFSNAGYDVLLGNDDINIGHTKMWSLLRLDSSGLPGLQFTEECRGKGGPIWQMSRYAWDDWINNKVRSQKDVKEKPKQFAKDFPDICRYVAMEDLDFKTLMKGPQVISAGPIRPYGRVA